MNSIVLSTAYFPNIEYISKINASDIVTIDIYEHYRKQTFRNRCQIYSSNGLLDLSIPIVKEKSSKTIIKDLKISYDEDWQRNHSRAIVSAYKKTPFYDYFIDEFTPFFYKKYTFLLDLNNDILFKILSIIKLDKQIVFSNQYIEKTELFNDFRDEITPKLYSAYVSKEYKQTFMEKNGFIGNLSVLDLIFHKGNKIKELL